ncbi:phytoene desaturase [Salinarchaeum sp. Harcht-Bsk1]|uniref:phytoene desaturase family protein n=1 Tax=Salinarchaeum sp. Harcht-Bsk1 TaxID=1333523 RepID=UPI00034248AD|nr:phytoene desaturase [Salinarchaeum sp. Harcht-Bsk1]
MTDLGDRSVAVIGSGFGGLSTACFLADAGADVTVYERNEQLGGRASRLYRDGFRFDMGPSWYLMPDVFERFFAYFDREPTDYYDLTRLDPHYGIYFKDGDSIDVPADHRAAIPLFEEYEEGAGAAFEDYLAEAQRTYEVGMEHFVYHDRSRPADWLDPGLAKHGRGLSFLGSMEDHVADYFEHPKLRQIVQYSLVFLGGSPSNTPALYNLMSHVDFGLGVWYPEGGLGGVVDAIVELGTELGVEYRVNCDVTAIRGREGGFSLDVERTAGAERFDPVADVPGEVPPAIAIPEDGPPAGNRRLVPRSDAAGRTPVANGGTASATDGSASANGGTASATGGATSAAVPADLVVSDADLAHVETELLDDDRRDREPAYWDDRTYAPSAFLLYLGVEGDVPNLDHHTLVLPPEWDGHFDQIFKEPAWPDDPAYYVCAPSVTDDSVAPEGHSNLFVLVPIAPGLDDDEATRQAYRDQVLADLAEHSGEDVRDRIVVEESFCVSDFGERYNAAKGTALGMAHTLTQTAVLRPSHRSSAVDGLYFTGSYTTPGIGVPMCLISGEHAADKVLEDHAH